MDQVLHVLRDPPLDGPTNMARDEHLLHSEPLCGGAKLSFVLRIYGWEPPTISLGYFQRYADVARLPEDVRGLAVVRRMTGGGAILHDREVTYALVLDDSVPAAGQRPVALYRLTHECWRDALADDGLQTELAPDSFPMATPHAGPFFCFEKPGRTDLLIDGRKVLGSAQRRIAGRVLQHGSLLLGRRFASHPGADLGAPPAERVARWIDQFVTRLAGALGVPARPTEWTAEQLADVARRRPRFAGDEWTRRR